jgi:phage FluMu gp28-like protein
MPRVAEQFLWSIDTPAFASACGVELDPWQVELINGSGNWLARCARQVGKSTAAALKALRQGMFTRNALVLLVSSSERQSRELFAKVSEYSGILNLATDEQTKGSMQLRNGSRIIALPGSPATIRGFSAPRLVIVDEAAFVNQEVIAAVRPMLAISRGDLVLISTPNLRDDYFDTQWCDGHSYNRIQVTADECRRISPEWLEDQRKALPPFIFDREYRCIPMEATNAMFGGDLLARAFSEEVSPLNINW